METINTRGRRIDIPAHVSELTPRQYEYYCILASMLGTGRMTMAAFRRRWLSYLIGMGDTDYTLLRPEYIAELDAQLAVIDSFLIAEQAPDGQYYRLDFDTPVNLLPEYCGYHGPGDWLNGVTFGEFVECLTVIESMVAAPSLDDVADGYRQIARVLYHIPASDPVPELLGFHAPMLFAAVWRAIQSAPVEINGRKIDFAIIFQSTSRDRRPDDHTGWAGITFEVASAGLFGNVGEVERTDFWAVLIYLYKCKFDYIHEMSKTAK